MFVFRAVFIVATIFVAFVAQGMCRGVLGPGLAANHNRLVVSAVPPLTRFMLDAIPEGSENGADPSVAVSGVDASTSVPADADVPVAAESSPVQEDSAVESLSATSSANPSAADLAASVPVCPLSPIPKSSSAYCFL